MSSGDGCFWCGGEARVEDRVCVRCRITLGDLPDGGRWPE